MKLVTALATKYKIKANVRTGIHIDGMTDIEIHFLLSWFVYHLTPELRGKLMNEHPVLYKRLVNLKEPTDITVPGEQPKVIDRKAT